MVERQGMKITAPKSFDNKGCLRGPYSGKIKEIRQGNEAAGGRADHGGESAKRAEHGFLII